MSDRKLSRQQLYEQVWSVSASRLATEFGLSDVGLAKLCKRHDIPRPPRGYWAKKEVGKAPAQTPLPPGDNGDQRAVRHSFLADRWAFSSDLVSLPVPSDEKSRE